MTTEEKNIKEAGDKYSSYVWRHSNGFVNTSLIEQSFIDGAKSLEAKEYWQKGMYTEDETEFLCLKAMRDGMLCIKGRLPDFDQDIWFNKYRKK